MKGIQILLLGLLVIIFIYVISRLKNRKADIIILSTLIISGCIFILFPDWTIYLAHKLGVGRGTDLVFYISTLIFWFVLLKLYARIRRLEQLLTQIIRNETLNNIQSPNESSL